MANSYLRSVQVEEGALVVARIDHKTQREKPPFEDIRDDVLDDWAKQEAVDIAIDRLESLREAMAEKLASTEDDEDQESDTEEPDDGIDATQDDSAVADQEDSRVDAEWTPVVDAETFRTKVEEAGLTVIDRPWMGRRDYPDDDPAAASAGDRFIVNTATLYELDEGAVPAPGHDFQKTSHFLVRFEGEQEPDTSDMKALDVLNLRNLVQREDQDAFISQVLDPRSDWFQETYGVSLRKWDAAKDEESEEEDPPAGE